MGRVRQALKWSLLLLLPLSAAAQGYPPFLTPLTAGDCLKVAANGVQGQASGSPCGVGTVSPGTINQLARYAATGSVISGLPTANNGILVTSAGGVPSISSTAPAGLTIPTPSISSPTLSGTVAGANTIPLTILAQIATNTVLGNAAAGTANVAALAMPSCSTAGSALKWTTDTGFGCNGAIDAATLGGATFAAPGAIGGGTPGAGTFTALRATAASLGAALTVNDGGLGGSTTAAAASAPGAAGGKIEWRCGTNAGSIKLVAYGGTDATGVTVTDNIGSGVSGC